MTKEEAKGLYEGKYFYEIVKPKTGGGIQLFGPFDNIYYANTDIEFNGVKPTIVYKFIQVIDGKPILAFTEDEILVTDREL